MSYTIIIAIHNEEANIPALLKGLEPFTPDHEIFIIDDGSTDGSYEILSDCSFISLLKLDQNYGKGVAIKKGIEGAINDKITITDGDLELDPREIRKLMILSTDNEVQCVFGSRYKNINPIDSLWDFGNFFFTGLFNMIHRSSHSDVLCCAKAFYKDDIGIDKLSATGFDIDVELAINLTKSLAKIHTVNLSYMRRSKERGKKLRLLDGWIILKRILKG